MNKKKILIALSILIISLIGIFMIYLCTGTYRAEEICFDYLESTDTVKISKIKEGYFFDGPGNDSAIIFYPGAKVEYTAYNKLMYQIAENGKDCFLVKMPFNMAIFGVNKAQDIINEYVYEDWYISGHSMGGAMACDYVSNYPEKISGVIVFAAYPTKELPSSIKYISFYGTEDKVLSKNNYENSKRYIPQMNEEYIIEGGNHAGFANYGKQKSDGEAQISADEQQEFVVSALSR